MHLRLAVLDTTDIVYFVQRVLHQISLWSIHRECTHIYNNFEEAWARKNQPRIRSEGDDITCAVLCWSYLMVIVFDSLSKAVLDPAIVIRNRQTGVNANIFLASRSWLATCYTVSMMLKLTHESNPTSISTACLVTTAARIGRAVATLCTRNATSSRRPRATDGAAK